MPIIKITEKIVHTGQSCQKGDCDCNIYNGLGEIVLLHSLPFHDDCDCYLEEKEIKVKG